MRLLLTLAGALAMSLPTVASAATFGLTVPWDGSELDAQVIEEAFARVACATQTEFDLGQTLKTEVTVAFDDSTRWVHSTPLMSATGEQVGIASAAVLGTGEAFVIANLGSVRDNGLSRFDHQMIIPDSILELWSGYKPNPWETPIVPRLPDGWTPEWCQEIAPEAVIPPGGVPDGCVIDAAIGLSELNRPLFGGIQLRNICM